MTTDAEKDGGGTVTIPDAAERKRRIEVLYMAATMQAYPHGSKSWLARLLGVTPKSVRRWTIPGDREEGARTPSAKRWAEIESLEEEVGAERLKRAAERREEYLRKNPEGAADWERYRTES